MNNKELGNMGEKEIVSLVACPNCKNKLMRLPLNYPLVDIQCSACYFRAQVKTVNSSPKNISFGAGWEIMNKVLKAGYPIPSLIANFKWKTSQEIRFYPFIPKENLKRRVLSPTARRANYKMFNYTGLTNLPYFKLY